MANRRQSGFSLIELMIALLLGLLVAAAAGGVFVSNKRVYSATETLGRIQENSRVAFELMARDLREAGGNPCGTSSPPVSMLTGSETYWDTFGDGITGYAAGTAFPGSAAGSGVVGTGVAQRVAGTDAVEIHGARGNGEMRVTSHPNPSAEIDVNSAAGIELDEVLLICNMSQSFVFQVTHLPGTGTQIGHNSGSSLNCTDRFLPEGCGAPAGSNYCFSEAAGAGTCGEDSNTPAYVARATSTRWYVGNNARGGASLYRAEVVNRSATNNPDVVLSTVEVVEGVDDMEIGYLEDGSNDYVAAGAVGDFAQVTAVQVALTLTGTRGALTGGELEGTDGEVLQRVMTNVVALRNREDLL